ncbi:hypothetical protein EUGRSUZ_E00676 [Eucalyptus grandis]|uniref:Uncharacterized protein n=3 Tax=Eucalyptus grandis TaxID=71139 RepID=A0A059C1I3_EUCGR|nr:hypothetical protein EUGRSUZ_E00676 [Eucalyptus grandis]KAK3429267.1 hypothetical protein EUGRSUZ_E00676 [Eucalyptus grandis]
MVSKERLRDRCRYSEITTAIAVCDSFHSRLSGASICQQRKQIMKDLGGRRRQRWSLGTGTKAIFCDSGDGLRKTLPTSP